MYITGELPCDRVGPCRGQKRAFRSATQLSYASAQMPGPIFDPDICQRPFTYSHKMCAFFMALLFCAHLPLPKTAGMRLPCVAAPCLLPPAHLPSRAWPVIYPAIYADLLYIRRSFREGAIYKNKVCTQQSMWGRISLSAPMPICALAQCLYFNNGCAPRISMGMGWATGIESPLRFLRKKARVIRAV